MTISEMHIKFRLFVDNLDSQITADFEPFEIDDLLNEAIKRFVKSAYSGTQYSNKKKFQEDQKLTDTLNSITGTFIIESENPEIPVELPGVESSYIRAFKFPLSNLKNFDGTNSSKKYWIYLRGRPEIKISKDPNPVVKKWISEFLILQLDDLEKVLNDPFNKPTASTPKGYFENDSVFILTSPETEVLRFSITCLFEPAIVSLDNEVNCDLPQMVHDEIVQLAVSIALESTESNRFSNQFQLNNTTK